MTEPGGVEYYSGEKIGTNQVAVEAYDSKFALSLWCKYLAQMNKEKK